MFQVYRLRSERSIFPKYVVKCEQNKAENSFERTASVALAMFGSEADTRPALGIM